jgi:hypothetical protein
MRLSHIACAIFAMTAPATAGCFNLVDSCADEPLPMSGDSFAVQGKGSRFVFGSGPNSAVLASAASGCAQRGFTQFVIEQAQAGEEYHPPRGFGAWGDGYGNVYGHSYGGGSVATTNAVVRCVRKGGISVQQYLQAD